MVKKIRNKPFNVLVYEALFRRLREQYRNNSIINSDYQKYYAGYRGEKSVDYKLQLMPHQKYLYLPSLRLNNNSLFFQLDTLILTKKFFCILEIKNYQDRLIYDAEQKQLVQIVGDKEYFYKDPILQAETQKMNFNNWLATRGITGIPIETLVVSANPSTNITNLQNDPMFYSKFIHAENLPFQLQQIDSNYSEEILTSKKLNNLRHTLIKANSPFQPNLLELYGVQDIHLNKGVACPNCHSHPMQYAKGKWFCKKCQYKDRFAHERLILDFFLLHQKTITNRECREILQINSPRLIYKFLKAMKLKKTGITSDTKYHAPCEMDYPQDSKLPNRKKSVLSI